MERIVYGIVALALITASYDTLKAVVRFYTAKDLCTPKFWFFRFRGNNVFWVIVLNFGLLYFGLTILPKSGGTFAYELPATFEDAVRHYTGVAFSEELLYRFLPWLLFFAARKANPDDMLPLRLHVFVAIGMSIFFGYLHLANFANPDIWTVVGLLAQVVTGMLLWYLLEYNGIATAILAHFVLDMGIWILTKI